MAKIIDSLPAILQTPALKNFFEGTAEQLFSKANTISVNGYVGNQTGEEYNVEGSFISEYNADRNQYAFSPVVNTLDLVTGNTDSVVFYDEFVDTLKNYGAPVRDHNHLFASNYQTFLPPIDIDKFLNFKEYFWSPAGPTAIDITPSGVSSAIAIDKDIIGKKTFTPTGGKAFRTGMIVRFTGSNVIPGDNVELNKKYIVRGVGTSIRLEDYELSTATTYGGSQLANKDYIVIEHGAPSGTAWSRVNHWFHENNFLDAGDTLPLKKYRANRPILEFFKDLELYDHGGVYKGHVTLNSTSVNIAAITGLPGAIVDTKTLVNGDTIVFPNESVTNRNKVFTVSGVGSSISLTATTTIAENDVYNIDGGFNHLGKELKLSSGELVEVQRKTNVNVDPLFKLYDDNKIALDDAGTYPQASFKGGKIFGYKIGSGTDDTELGFPLAYSNYKTVSEITFSDFLKNSQYTSTAFGSSTATIIKGDYYFKNGEEYSNNFKSVDKQSRQKVKTKYIISIADVDDKRTVYDVGCIPVVKSSAPSGRDIIVRVNNIIQTAYTYANQKIQFTEFNLSKGDILEIEADTTDGITFINESRYDIPLSWKANPLNESFTDIAEPEFLPHFKKLMESQDDFSGDSLGKNNYNSIAQDISHADLIVKTDEDLIHGAFLLDDQPHNLVDSLRFVGREYSKYKKRLAKEINNYNNNFDLNKAGLSIESALETVLRNLKSFSVGKGVFNSTYILPFGDNFTKETIIVNDVSKAEYTLSNYADLNTLENSLLIYHVRGNTINKLLLVDEDYTIDNSNPIKITLSSSILSTFLLDDNIVAKFYNKDRDSAETPPTPSTMGLYPLFHPKIETDNSFQTPIQVLIGHDGSRTALLGDKRDDVLLEYEKRVYNSALKSLRDASSVAKLSVHDVRPGAFRSKVNVSEYNDMLRNSFTNWTGTNKVDEVVNEFFDETNKWTWNYKGTNDIPGHWRGWYEYYYDTVRPHTHPWEMLGFYDKPTWWDTQYGTSYGLSNTALWSDLEKGIIRQGVSENLTNDRYTKNNPFARSGLSNYYPITSAGVLKSPGEIVSTGATTLNSSYSNARTSNTNVITNSIILTDQVSSSFDSNNVYITSGSLNNNYNIPILASYNVVTKAPAEIPNNFIGVTVTGVPIVNPIKGSWKSQGVWNYNAVKNNETLTEGVYQITPASAGLTSWSTTEASPKVGWAFDGLPIYGPYGYEDPSNTSSNVVAISSIFELKTGTRPSGPSGSYTGHFVEDYQANTALAGTNGYVTNVYNARYGYTVDSPSTKIWHYVASDNFPFVIGGVVNESSDFTYKGKYYKSSHDITNNNNANVTIPAGTSVAITSNLVETVSKDTTLINNPWQLGDGAPVENAWKYSEDYPFAVVEALLLSKPGKFASVFAEPLDVITPLAEDFKLVDKDTRNHFDFRSNADFKVHGITIEDSDDIQTNIGYTQFIYSWLKFQGLPITTNFVDKLQTVNTKLAHRLAGYTDKDTLIVRTDQFSPTGTSSSLIVPTENIDLLIHNSPYKSRNFYSGVSIEKTTDGYKVRGFDKNFGYFNTLAPDKNGRTSSEEVAGTPVNYVAWQPATSYPKGVIVEHLGSYYQAPTQVTSSDSFLSSMWDRLPSLPQEGSVKGVAFIDTTNEVKRVNYNTEFTDYQEVYQFLIDLGKYQEQQGFAFDDFDTGINEERNWFYAAKQFLFFVAGGWETNNVLELSPSATRIIFEKDKEFISKINRVDRNQFALLDQSGKAITPQDCVIVRTDNKITIEPPTGSQIYGCMLFTQQIEHALVVDNKTDFNDTIFNTVMGQKQNRIKIKGSKTNNWKGKFLSEGYIIQGDELKPNLDNMAQTLGRYYELGFIPVEKQIYETSRKNFGYLERDYLNDLDIDDDTQFEFFTGFLQGKGTANSVVKLAKSNSIVQGNMSLYSEWAIKTGEFGDLENDQPIELKLEKVDVKQNPQLITLAFPEDTTGAIDKIDVLSPQHKYFAPPTIEISEPTTLSIAKGGIQATATASLASNGTLGSFTITNQGKGYVEPVVATVVAGNVVLSDTETTLRLPTADGTFLNSSNVSGLLGANVQVTDNFPGTPIAVNFNFSTEANLYNVASAIDSNASLPNVNASVTTAEVVSSSNSIITLFKLSITGKEFRLNDSDGSWANLNLTKGIYETRQRFSVVTVDNEPTLGTGATTINDIVVKNGTTTLTANSDFTFDSGSRQEIDFIVNASTVAEDIQRVDPADSTGSLSPDTVFSGNVTIALPTTLHAKNVELYNNFYPHLDVFIDGVKVSNENYSRQFNATTSVLTILNIDELPSGTLKTGQKILVVESGTIEFADAYKGDIADSKITIKTTTKDSIAIKTKSIRSFDITPDIKGDETILIDIDDSSRFLRKPIGVRESNLWPTSSQVSFKGITDSKYNFIPNAGYVDERTVDYQTFDIPSIAGLFSDAQIYQPDINETIHVGVAENRDFNVYKVKEVANTTVAFVEQEEGDATTYLYKNGDSLFNYVDTNFIQSSDTGRYLDYHLIIKDGELSDKFVVWTNEELIENKQVRLKNLYPPVMTEKTISAIGPNTGAVLPISSITPAPSGFATAQALTSQSPGANVILINTIPFTLENGETVSFGHSEGNANCSLHANSFIVSEVGPSSFKIKETDQTGVSVQAVRDMAANTTLSNLENSASMLSYTFFGKTRITCSSNISISSNEVVKVNAKEYSGYFQAEAVNHNSFVIDRKYLTSSSTNTGNVLLPEVKITVPAHGINPGYAGKKIAVHNVDPRYYNLVYKVKSIPDANTIITSGVFPYDHQNISQSASNKPTVSTLDHDVVHLNNSAIKFNNTNSLDAMVQDFNFQQEIKRGFMVHEGSFGISIPMLNHLDIPGIGKNAKQIIGKMPYLTNTQHNLIATGKPVDPPLKKLPNTGRVGNHLQVPPKIGNIKYNVGTALTTGWKNTSPINPTVATAIGNIPSTLTSINLPTIPTIAPITSIPSKINQPKAYIAGNELNILNYADALKGKNALVDFGQYGKAYVGGIGNYFQKQMRNKALKLKQNWQRTRAQFIKQVDATRINNARKVDNQVSTWKTGISKGQKVAIHPGYFLNGINGTFSGMQFAGGRVAQEVDINGKKFFIPENFLVNLGSAVAGPGTNNFVKIPNQTTPTGSGPAGSQGSTPTPSTSSTATSTPSNTGSVVIDPSAAVTQTAKTPCGTDLPPVYVDPTPPTSNSNVSVPAANATPGNANVIVSTPVPCSFIAREKNQQSTNAHKVDDTWHYRFKCKGRIKVVFDMYSAADKFEFFQTTTKTTTGGKLLSTTASFSSIRKATNVEKQELLGASQSTSVGTTQSNSGGYNHASSLAGGYNSSQYASVYQSGPAGNPYGQTHRAGAVGSLKDFENGGSGKVKFCGVLEFDFDPVNGEHVRLDVDKDSNVYRYYIEYPSDTDTGLASTGGVTPGGANLPANNGQTNYGSGNPGSPGGTGYQSPFVTPSGQPQTKKATGGGGGGLGRYGYAHYAYKHNFGGFGNPSGSGFNFLPSVYKKKVKVTWQPSIPDNTPLTGSQYVNTSFQRVSGGIIVPLAQPVPAPIEIAPRPIRGRSYSRYASMSGNLDLLWNPATQRFTSRFDTNKLDSMSGIGANNTVSITQYPGLPGYIPGTMGPGSGPIDALAPPVEIDGRAFNEREADFNPNPVLKLIPKKKKDGIFSASKPIFAPLRFPNPQACIPLNDLGSLTAGDELIINGTRITIPGGGVNATMNAIMCQGGNGYKVSQSAKDGQKAIRITSCTNAPLTFRDGCRGGAYKEVLDFHIVRSFTSGESRTNDAIVIPPTTGVVQGANNDSIGSVTSTYTRYLEDGTNVSASFGSVNSTTGATFFNVSKQQTSGGDGYAVGDRLRVVGGTPVPSPHGGINEVCVNIPGAGYSSPANVKIFIGDGSTPGSGATVSSVNLNADGGISSVVLSNRGSGYSMENPPEVRVIDLDPNSTNTPAQLSVKIGSGKGFPERVAKFEVLSVVTADSLLHLNEGRPVGEIISLRVIDRGVYKVFPSDLTNGVPLEYDNINFGDEDDGTGSGSGLGQYDPLRKNADLASPGAYDPIRGLFGGGTGARIFLTSREIPDCSERGDAKRALGLPDQITDTDIPFSLVNDLNEGLIGAGYDPSDLEITYSPGQGGIGFIGIHSPIYDGIEFDEVTPGMLSGLGIPAGDYNNDIMCMYMSDETSVTESNPVIGGDGDYVDEDGFKINNSTLEEEVSIICVDTLTADPSSLFGNASVTFTGDLYQYELRSAQNGGPVRLNKGISQSSRVAVLESLRYNKETDIANAAVEFAGISTTNKNEFANVWIDDVNGKWAYYENGTLKAQQENLVDSKFVKNAILYDDDTGDKEFDYHLWDPFKGVIPGFIDAEIEYVGENDPVAYNSARSSFGRDNVGQIWWDTSTIRYKWYEQGSNRQRWLDWGKSMPGSGITLYEWCESEQLPLEYTGTGTPKNGSEFIADVRYDSYSGDFKTYYYYWIQNKEEITGYAGIQNNRKFTTVELARYLADPIGQGLHTLSFVSNTSLVAGNLGTSLREEDDILQINISRNLNPIGLKHNAWKLLREGDNNSNVPTDIGNKLIDSLCEVNAIGEAVPDSTLSEAEKYGSQFRPRQTFFKYPKEARRVAREVLNEILAGEKVRSINPNWATTMPSRTYIIDANWYEVDRIDNSNNKKIRFTSQEKAILNVQSEKELDSLKQSGLPDGGVVMVRGSATDRYQLWKWNAKTSKFSKIAIENETVRIKKEIYSDTINATLQNELRKFLELLRDDIFVGTEYWNKFFFEMLKYAYGEQKQLDWAFKTSYLFVEKEEEDLNKRISFSPDNFNPVLEYMEEAKAYTAKVREYKDAKKTPLEYISGQMISDFDKPPYPDPVAGKVRILNPGNADDQSILSTNGDYVKWWNNYALSNTIVRAGNVRLVFDRVDWRMLDANCNISSTSYSQSIANNIVKLNSSTNAQVQANANFTASARIFKYDQEVRTQFVKDIDTYFGAGANANVSYTQNVTSMYNAVNSGALTKTLELVKTKVGGGFRGEELDANVFTKESGGSFGKDMYRSAFGFDTAGFDDTTSAGGTFDSSIEVNNYIGTFTGNITFRKNNETVEGFDGVTFQRVLYGEERPEELALLSPLENLVFDITTSPFAFDGNSQVVGAISVGPYSTSNISRVGSTLTINNDVGVNLLSNSDVITLSSSSANISGNAFTVSNVASTSFTVNIPGLTASDVSGAGNVTFQKGPQTTEVEYIVHHDMFGGEDYYRVLRDGSTSSTLAKKFNIFDDELTVADATKLPTPAPGKPGVVWVNGSERIEYRLVVGNTIKSLTRGTRGTTIQDHNIGLPVVSGANTEIFDDSGNAGFGARDPREPNWLKTDGSTQGLTDITNRSTVVTIAAFLHGDSTSAVGFDVRGFDTDTWDGI